jgi:uncharacterized protein YndB with AHSA1/START domain
MKADSTIEPVRKSVELACGPADAFRLFTDEIDSWWPLATHSVGETDAVACFFEGRDGGRIYETCKDGTIHLWGTVTAWEPSARVVFSWHPGRDAATAQEVELRFIGTKNGTRVELEHRGWETLGDRAVETRKGYDTGWVPVLEGFVARGATSG